MIVSASRRTDIPAFYSAWLLNRLAAGDVTVVNPFNPAQQRRISVRPDDVDAIVFWTRRPGALLSVWPQIEARGHHRAAALVTINDYGRDLEPHMPAPQRAAADFRKLADCWGPARLAWRYDPIVIGPRDTPDDHRRRFEGLCRALEGSTGRAITSFLDLHRKTRRRLAGLEPGGYPVAEDFDVQGEAARALLGDLAAMAAARGMELATCAEPVDDLAPGVRRGRCIDPDWLSSLFPDRPFPRRKDPGQRPACGCAPAVDIGATDTCLAGCAYCYAVSSPARAMAAHAAHRPEADALAPHAAGP